MNAEQWLTAYASKLGTVPPTDDELETLLALAGVAAHSSERKAGSPPARVSNPQRRCDSPRN